jgi:hypothetical protein
MNSESALSRPHQNHRESSIRSVEGVYRGDPLHWVGNGFHVSTYFPTRQIDPERVSPFVLMDYGEPKDFGPLAKGKRGVGWHPHRGFETVTLAWEGGVAHRDNAGNHGLIGPGDAQWMTAGAGIFHEEYHAEPFTRMGGRMHMMQLWVNLPKRNKFAAPAYQAIAAAQVPTVQLEGGQVRVLAGEFEGAAGPARTFTPITMLDARLNAGGRLSVPLPAGYNALAVVAKGRIRVGDTSAGRGDLVLYRNDGTRLECSVDEDCHLVVLAGEPLGEPVVQYGPFVMNTREEIEQAIVDVELGRFGRVPD